MSWNKKLHDWEHFLPCVSGLHTRESYTPIAYGFNTYYDLDNKNRIPATNYEYNFHGVGFAISKLMQSFYIDLNFIPRLAAPLYQKII